jgi:hypothetical protein
MNSNRPYSACAHGRSMALTAERALRPIPAPSADAHRTAVTTRGAPAMAQPPTVVRSTRCSRGGVTSTVVGPGIYRAW